MGVTGFRKLKFVFMYFLCEKLERSAVDTGVSLN